MWRTLLILVLAGTSIRSAQLRDNFGPCVASDKSINKIPRSQKRTNPSKRIPRVSDGLERMCFSSRPVYPPEAKAKKIEGAVVMAAIIGTDGFVKELRLISGDPLLAQSALEAVRQWRYKPFRLNKKPIEVETLITVNFKIDSGINQNSQPASPTGN